MKEKTFSRDAILALIGAFCYISCATMAMPITAGFTKSLGGSAELMGFMTGLMYLVSLCMRPVAGNMADKFSKAKLTIVGSGLMALSNFAYAMAPNLIVLTTARIVCGIGYAACTVSLSTWFSMLVPSNKVGKAMGIYGTMQAISMAIVGKVAVSVTNLTNERTAFVISGLFAVVTFALSFVIKDRGNPVIKEGVEKKKLRLLDLNVLPVAIILMLFTIPYNATQGLIKDYVLERNFLVDAGWFITMYAIFLIVLRVGFRNFFDNAHRLTHIITVHCFCCDHTSNLFNKNDIFHFFFEDCRKKSSMCLNKQNHVKKALMVGKQHVSAFLRKIFHTCCYNFNAADTINMCNQFMKQVVSLFFTVFFKFLVSTIKTQLIPPFWNFVQ